MLLILPTVEYLRHFAEPGKSQDGTFAKARAQGLRQPKLTKEIEQFFQFVFKGFDALDYKEHSDYAVIQSTNPDWNKAVVRVNIYRNHRQTITYFRPQDAHILGQAELVV